MHKKQRDIPDLSTETTDEGINGLMSDDIREQEKLVWMYSVFLANKTTTFKGPAQQDPNKTYSL